MEWCVFYGDGSMFSSADGDERDAPRWDVQAIPYGDEATGFSVASGKDYFVFEDGRWKSVDLIGMRDHCVTARFPLVLFGRTITDEAYEAILTRVERMFGPKSARRVWER